MRRIARRELGRLLLREGVTRRQLLVEIDDAVVEILAERGFHPRYGARPLQREIERAVIIPLARLLVEQARPGDLVRFTCPAGEICVSVEKVTVPAKPRRGSRPAPVAAEATLTRAGRRAAELYAEVEAGERVGAATQALRMELSALSRDRRALPGFWDDSTQARRGRWSGFTRSSVCSSISTGSAGAPRGSPRWRGRCSATATAAASPSSGRRSQRSRQGFEGCRAEARRRRRGRRVVWWRSFASRRSPVPTNGPENSSACTSSRGRRARAARRPVSTGSAFAVSINGRLDVRVASPRGSAPPPGVSTDAEPQLAQVTVSANGRPDAAGGRSCRRPRLRAGAAPVRPRPGGPAPRLGDVGAGLANGRIDEFLLAALRL